MGGNNILKIHKIIYKIEYKTSGSMFEDFYKNIDLIKNCIIRHGKCSNSDIIKRIKDNTMCQIDFGIHGRLTYSMISKSIVFIIQYFDGKYLAKVVDNKLYKYVCKLIINSDMYNLIRIDMDVYSFCRISPKLFNHMFSYNLPFGPRLASVELEHYTRLFKNVKIELIPYKNENVKMYYFKFKSVDKNVIIHINLCDIIDKPDLSKCIEVNIGKIETILIDVNYILSKSIK